MNVKNKRQLMWSEKLIDKNENVELIMHRPVKQNIALSCDEEWEGSCCGYPSMVKVGGEIRMYYRASTGYLALGNSEGRGIMCVAISHDGGKTFEKPSALLKYSRVSFSWERGWHTSALNFASAGQSGFSS